MFKYLKKIPIPFINKNQPIVAVVRLNGIIAADGRFQQGLNLANVAGALERAFSIGRVKAVALSINSPGGSPVQSTLIHNRIRALASEKGLPVFAFAEDVAASGGYMLAISADEIFADVSSIVGSIGVISSGFGFDKVIEKIGIDRRVYTAGDKKANMDPFQPESAEDVKRIETLQKEIHVAFRDMVKGRRGERLSGSDKRLFSGEFWAGKQAEKLGLIDGIGDLRTVMRQRYGEKVKFVVVSPEKSLLRRVTSGSSISSQWSDTSGRSSISGGWADQALSALEVKALWSRFGL